MKVITIANQKGGTAKTTSTAAIGVLLSRRGYPSHRTSQNRKLLRRMDVPLGRPEVLVAEDISDSPEVNSTAYEFRRKAVSISAAQLKARFTTRIA